LAEAAGVAARADDETVGAVVLLVVPLTELAVPEAVAGVAVAAVDVLAAVEPEGAAVAVAVAVAWLAARNPESPATPTTLTTPVAIRAPRAGWSRRRRR
jgi:hypothetical protein